jgi:hypothetical protein
MKIKFTLLFAFLSCVVLAQPQLQSSMLVTGSTYELFQLSNFNVPAIIQGGANVAWDVSGTSAIKVGEAAIIPASETPYAAQYPDANVAIRFQIGTETNYSLFKLSSSAFEMLADHLGGTSPTSYTISRHVLQFPLNFSDAFSDNYQKQGQVEKTAYFLYDAYGTVKTPDTLLGNVARIRQVNGDGDTSATWWNVSAAGLQPLMDAGSNGLNLWKLKSTTTTGIKESAQVSFITLYPNPTTSSIIVPVNESFTCQIYDVTGKLIWEQTNSLHEVDVTSLPIGLFHITIQTNSGQRFQSKFIKTN